jgi:predicted oxidoreductase
MPNDMLLSLSTMRRKDRRVVDVRVNFGGGKDVMFVSAIECARYFLVVALLRTIIAGATVDGSSGDLISVAVSVMRFAKQRTFVGSALIGMALHLTSLLITHILT